MDNFKFVQNQVTTVAGAGSSLGDTTIILTSLTQIDGTFLTMTDFGTIGFGTLEPGNGIQEEQISWTGITQNANGTATLTGVSTVLNVDPYTQTAGLATSHAGGVQFVVSNTAGFYNKLSAKNDDETITGTWTFTNPNYPRMDTATPPPTDDEQLATKKYVDDTAIAGAPDASTTVKGIVQEATQAQTDARTTTGSTSARLYTNPGTVRSTLTSDYAIDTGSTNAYIITPVPALTAYTVGQELSFKSTHANTAAATININSLGTKSLTKLDGTTALVANDIASGEIVTIEYTGSNFQVVNPSAKDFVDLTTSQSITSGVKTFTVLPQSATVPTTGSDLVNKTYADVPHFITTAGTQVKNLVDASTTQVITHGLGRTPSVVVIAGVLGTHQTSYGTYTSSGNFVTGFPYVSSGDATGFGTYSAAVAFGDSTGQAQTGVVAVTSTNFTITWTKINSPTGTASFTWMAY